jgi:hypothetical protein
VALVCTEIKKIASYRILIFRFSLSSFSFLQRVLSVWSNCGYSASHIFLLLCVRRKSKRTQTHPLEKRIRDTSKPKVFISFSLVHAGIPLSSTKHHHHSLAQIFEANAFVSAYQTNKEETSRLSTLQTSLDRCSALIGGAHEM